MNKLDDILKKNKEIIQNAKLILDSAATMSMIGAANDSKSRDLIVNGLLTSTSSALTLIGVSLFGFTGPVIIGIAVIPTITKLSMIAGFTSMFAGFGRGFRHSIGLTR